MEGCGFAVTFPAQPVTYNVDQRDFRSRSAFRLADYRGVQWRAVCTEGSPGFTRHAEIEATVDAMKDERERIGDRVIRSTVENRPGGPVGVLVYESSSAPGTGEAKRWWRGEEGLLTVAVVGPIEAITGRETDAFFASVRRLD